MGFDLSLLALCLSIGALVFALVGYYSVTEARKRLAACEKQRRELEMALKMVTKYDR